MPEVPDFKNEIDTINKDIIAIKQQIGLINTNGAVITEASPENIEAFTNRKNVSYRDYVSRFNLIPNEYAPAL
jgi:hypothetical protein